eukprot:14661681-Ditylum_brightwellii.AAC.1
MNCKTKDGSDDVESSRDTSKDKDSVLNAFHADADGDSETDEDISSSTATEDLHKESDEVVDAWFNLKVYRLDTLYDHVGILWCWKANHAIYPTIELMA